MRSLPFGFVFARALAAIVAACICASCGAEMSGPSLDPAQEPNTRSTSTWVGDECSIEGEGLTGWVGDECEALPEVLAPVTNVVDKTLPKLNGNSGSGNNSGNGNGVLKKDKK